MDKPAQGTNDPISEPVSSSFDIPEVTPVENTGFQEEMPVPPPNPINDSIPAPVVPVPPANEFDSPGLETDVKGESAGSYESLPSETSAKNEFAPPEVTPQVPPPLDIPSVESHSSPTPLTSPPSSGLNPKTIIALLITLVAVFAASFYGGYYIGNSQVPSEETQTLTLTPSPTLTPIPTPIVNATFVDGNYTYTLPSGWKVASDTSGEYVTDQVSSFTLRFETIAKTENKSIKDNLHAYVGEKNKTATEPIEITYVSEKPIIIGETNGWYAQTNNQTSKKEEVYIFIEDEVTGTDYAVLWMNPYLASKQDDLESLYMSFKNSAVKGISTSASPTSTKKLSPTEGIKTSVTVKPTKKLSPPASLSD